MKRCRTCKNWIEDEESQCCHCGRTINKVWDCNCKKGKLCKKCSDKEEEWWEDD